MLNRDKRYTIRLKSGEVYSGYIFTTSKGFRLRLSETGIKNLLPKIDDIIINNTIHSDKTLQDRTNDIHVKKSNIEYIALDSYILFSNTTRLI